VSIAPNRPTGDVPDVPVVADVPDIPVIASSPGSAVAEVLLPRLGRRLDSVVRLDDCGGCDDLPSGGLVASDPSLRPYDVDSGPEGDIERTRG
jgi:hypothetical protein